MSPRQGAIQYGSTQITFQVLFVERKTLEISVHPDGSVIVKAPLETPLPEVEQRICKRAGWIRRQLDYFRQFDPRTPMRRFVGGETHLYLGRQYRLKLESGEPEGVKLFGRYFLIRIRDDASTERVRCLMMDWYAAKAKNRFRESFERCWPAFGQKGLEMPHLQVRRMKKRWGSLSKSGQLTVNTDLVRASRECIDYVITHELCHLLHHDHGPGFYRLLEKVMPDWEKRKHRLEMALV